MDYVYYNDWIVEIINEKSWVLLGNVNLILQVYIMVKKDSVAYFKNQLGEG